MRRLPAAQLLLLGGTLALTLGVLEWTAPWLYSIFEGTPFPRAELLIKLERPSLEWRSESSEDLAKLPPYIANKVIHPYLGFVADPSAVGVNPLGFYGPLPKRDVEASDFRVGLFGGSVALRNAPYLQKALAAALPGRRVRVSCFALDGYKQPQQLLALAYLVAIGTSMDVAVNLDGFNEIALPYSENLVAGVNVFFPRSWQLFSRSLTSPEIAEKVVDLHRAKAAYDWWRSGFDESLVKHSNLLLLIWSMVERRKDRQTRQADENLRKLLREAPELPRDLGPPSHYDSPEALFDDLVRAWSEGSRSMESLCRASGIRYFHFLQPNQYVPGSKPLSKWERSNATTPGPFRDAATQAYPLLVAQGATLRASGIRFWDLTGVFSGLSETLYSDNCCHLNENGNQILAETMASILAGELGQVKTEVAPSR